MRFIRNLGFTIVAILFFEIIMWLLKYLCALVSYASIGTAIAICLFGAGILPMLLTVVMGFVISYLYKIAGSIRYAYWVSMIACIGYAIYYLISVWIGWASLDISVVYPIAITILYISGSWAVLAGIQAARDDD